MIILGIMVILLWYHISLHKSEIHRWIKFLFNTVFDMLLWNIHATETSVNIFYFLIFTHWTGYILWVLIIILRVYFALRTDTMLRSNSHYQFNFIIYQWNGIVKCLWGGFSIDDSILEHFFQLYFLISFILAVLTINVNYFFIETGK